MSESSELQQTPESQQLNRLNKILEITEQVGPDKLIAALELQFPDKTK